LHWVIECVRIKRLCDATAAPRRDAIEATEQTSRPRRGADHAEVLAEHDHRVEHAERGVDSVDAENACVANTPRLADRDRAW
jgi:hypothetical protein